MTSEQDHFWSLVEQERHVVWRLARALTRSYDDALDLMSETWVEAYKSFPQLRDHAAFRSFVSTIAVRLHRRRIWRHRIFIRLDDAPEIEYAHSNESSYDLGVLLHAIDRLPAREREAILLFELAECSLADLQKLQGGSLSGVKSRLHRARKKLERMVCEPESDASMLVLNRLRLSEV